MLPNSLNLNPRSRAKLLELSIHLVALSVLHLTGDRTLSVGELHRSIMYMEALTDALRATQDGQRP